jgi:hypothetical protein
VGSGGLRDEYDVDETAVDSDGVMVFAVSVVVCPDRRRDCDA